ncbi:DUF2255 family protein [Cellulomonas composti]|uniref:DUF2255 domain-containing protein n=1 Tax=Cellulomonas composti TaxID=266130 RepID=A0A511J7X1_9CELL|nr:DUF2255 family protein [Cellulomonas composti]GEL94078.1 hypothetical protein CCO02nite_07360 [Cellulomonas composti]
MSTWTSDELRRIGAADELEVSSLRPDGTPRPFVTIWSVVVDDILWIRSARGPDNGWFRRAAAAGEGRVRSGGVTRDVVFVVPDEPVHGALDVAYHRKYDRYGQGIVGAVVGPVAATATLRVDPR